MEHITTIKDKDPYFEIDVNTRAIINKSTTKTAVMQFDHNSERFTFSLPRFIENHDMTECDSIAVHYLNIDLTTNEKITGLYPITDIQVDPEDDSKVICTWLLSRNVTNQAGALSFLLRFECINDAGEITYSWSTDIFKGISVSSGIDNTNEVYAQYVDVLEQWKKDLDNKYVTSDKLSKVATSGSYNDLEDKPVIDNIYTIEQTANLFDKDSADNVGGYLLNKGKPVAVNGYSYSYPIPVQDGKKYYISVSGDVSGTYVATIYDANDNVLKGTSHVVNTTDIIVEKNGDYWCFAIPESLGASYIRCSYKNTTIDSMMVVESDTVPTKYIPYGTQTCLNNDAKKLINNEIQTSVNPLFGKKISLNGDSICYGAGNSGGYGAIIAERNNMIVQNIGKNGGTITAEVYNDDGTTPRHWISRSIVNMDSDSDYIIIEGGVNDSSLSVPLGAITADYGDTLDDTTFYGAFESMLKQLLTRFPGKKIGYIAVHQMSTNFRANNEKETSYYWASKLCCEKWGVPFLDLNTTVPPFGMIRNITSQAELYGATRAIYTHNADGWHPNDEGYRKYYVPKIESWLKSL